jgi:hypothetical protein
MGLTSSIGEIEISHLVVRGEAEPEAALLVWEKFPHRVLAAGQLSSKQDAIDYAGDSDR